MRAGMIANEFSKQGDTVTWWFSTWLHYQKQHLYYKDTDFKVNENLLIKLVHVKKGYKKNISFARILYSVRLAKKLKNCLKKEIEPNVIYCSWPLMLETYYVVKYAKKRNVPIVIDIRDFWPDIFIQVLPKRLQKFGMVVLRVVLGHIVSFSMKNATKIIGISQDAVNLSYRYGRKPNPIDTVVYLSYQKTGLSIRDELSMNAWWDKLNINENNFTITYIGSINNRVDDADLLIELAQYINKSKLSYNLIICGNGQYFANLKKRVKNLKNVFVLGFIDANKISKVLSVSSLGLLNYRNTPDFYNSLPNKFAEYLSSGVLVATELKGISRSLVEQNNCGFYFQDIKMLICKLEFLIKDFKNIKQMKNNAYRLFLEKLDAETVYSNLCKDIKLLKS